MDHEFTVVAGAIGDLFWKTAQPVLVFRSVADHGADRVASITAVAVNPVAAALMGVEPSAGGDAIPAEVVERVFGTGTAEMLRLVEDEGSGVVDARDGCGRMFTASSWHLEGASGMSVVMLRDVTEERRHLGGLEHLNRLARDVMAEPQIEVVLQRVVDDAKALTGAAFSALILLRDGSATEIERFVYNAPRDLFPLRLPRVVGLLAVPIETGVAARLDDIRDHRGGVGIPVQHPPIAALLAVPVALGPTVIGELAVANEPGQRAFDDVDQALLGELAAQTAIATSLAAARQMQAEAAQTQRALIDVALHNIRTPVTVAMGFLDVLRLQGDRLTDAERSQSLDALTRALERIRDLSNDALLAAPEDPVEPDAELGTVDPVAVVDALVHELTNSAGTVRLTAASEVPDGLTFPGQPKVVHDMVENLVTNAIKHSAGGQTVAITVRVEGASVRFDVSDQGPGVAAAEQSRIFEQFYRTDASREADIAGTGLGLWIVKRLVTSQGGAVGVSSSLGQGSTFWLTFPRNGGKPPAAVAEFGHG
jgi:signal transduction histidine kinase